VSSQFCFIDIRAYITATPTSGSHSDCWLSQSVIGFLLSGHDTVVIVVIVVNQHVVFNNNRWFSSRNTTVSTPLLSPYCRLGNLFFMFIIVCRVIFDQYGSLLRRRPNEFRFHIME